MVMDGCKEGQKAKEREDCVKDKRQRVQERTALWCKQSKWKRTSEDGG